MGEGVSDGVAGTGEAQDSWQLAEAVSPDGCQHIPNRARWSAEMVRDQVHSYVVDNRASATTWRGGHEDRR